jgi:hypothetical protein
LIALTAVAMLANPVSTRMCMSSRNASSGSMSSRPDWSASFRSSTACDGRIAGRYLQRLVDGGGPRGRVESVPSEPAGQHAGEDLVIIHDHHDGAALAQAPERCR